VSEPKNHHYIPEFYLSRWARGDGRVVIFSRPRFKVVISWHTPEHTGYEPGLYSLLGASPETAQILEKLFMARVIDDEAAKALAFVVDHRGRGMTADHAIRIVHFILSLRARHPAAIDLIRREGERVLLAELGRDPSEYAALRGPNDPPDLKALAMQHLPLKMQNFGLLQLPELITRKDFVLRVSGMRWRVVDCASAGIDLVTSDRPAYIKGSLIEGPCLALLPASPTLLLVLSTDLHLLNAATRGRPSEVVRRANIECIRHAAQRVYATSERHLPAVEKYFQRTAAGTN
jgi:hypothetical protein